MLMHRGLSACQGKKAHPKRMRLSCDTNYSTMPWMAKREIWMMVLGATSTSMISS